MARRRHCPSLAGGFGTLGRIRFLSRVFKRSLTFKSCFFRALLSTNRCRVAAAGSLQRRSSECEVLSSGWMGLIGESVDVVVLSDRLGTEAYSGDSRLSDWLVILV